MKLYKNIQSIAKEYNYFNYLEKEIPELKKNQFYVSVKDAVCVNGMPTSAGSKMLSNYKPRFDATVVKRLRDVGGVIIGKTSMDAFGFGSFNVNVGLDKKIPLNPINKKRVCGGSSGGAAGFTKKFDGSHWAIGESTGGSIACPASFCGVVGLTPTYGRVSRYGLIDYANSMDKIGPICKTTKECGEMLQIIAGADGKDSTCIEMKNDFLELLGKDCQKLKIGIIREGFGKGVDPEVSTAVKEAINKMGVQAEEIKLPLTMKYGIATYYLIAMSEVSTNLAKLCGLRYGQEKKPDDISFNDYFTQVRSENFNSETKRRIILGTFARMAGFRDAFYLKAMKVRTLIIEEYQKLFERYDVLISPTMPIVAPTFDEAKKLSPLQNYMMDILTVGPNLAGMPHLSIPCGTSKGMPIGMIMIANHFNEKILVQLGDFYEQVRGEFK
jgi:aspartyl-tRNA(Asn)/glutamyl-tRNA(Gln) amidotransferase subunit A